MNIKFFTCNQHTCNLQASSAPTSVSSHDAAESAKTFFSCIETIQHPTMRIFLVLWAHVCVLKSLLELFSYHPRLALLLVVRSAAARSFVTSFFRIFGSEPISAALPSQHFYKQMLLSKDTPLLISTSQGDSAAKNLYDALNAIDAGVSWKDEIFELQSLITIISDSLPAAAASEKLIVMEVDSEDIGTVDTLLLSRIANTVPGYFQSFCHYVSEHLDIFQKCMFRGLDVSLQEDFSQEASSAMFGILLGTHELISEYLSSLNLLELLPALTLESKIFAKDVLDTSDRPCVDSLGETFLYLTRKLLNSGEIQTCLYEPLSCSTSRTEEAPLAYVNETTVCLNRQAFKLITDCLPQSSPLILRALNELGALAGATTNESTFRTKIRVIAPSGYRQCISVVRLRREMLEEPGQPLSF